MKDTERFLIIDYTDLKNKQFTQADLLVYSYIKSYIKFKPKELFNKSNSFIANELGIGKSSVIRAINHLEKMHYIKVVIGKSQGVYSNRSIYLKNRKDDQNIDVVALFEKVYKDIKNS